MFITRKQKKTVRAAAICLALMLVLMGFAACGNKEKAAKDDSKDATQSETVTQPGNDATDADSESETSDAEPISPAQLDAPAAQGSSTAPPTSGDTPASSSTPSPAPTETKPASPSTSGGSQSGTGGGSSGAATPTPKPTPKPDPKPAAPTTPPKQEPSSDITVTIAVDCKLLYKEDPDLASMFSDKGIMQAKKNVTVKSGATVLDVLKASGLSYAGSSYISKLMGLSEKDAGSGSGWCYSVNGSFPNLGVSKVTVKDGDAVAFRYSLNNGTEFGVKR